MNSIKKNLLKELYPLDTSASYRWRSILFFGLFVFLFLWVFQPFGLSADIPNKMIILLGYGLVTSFGVWVFNMVLPPLFPNFFLEEKWYVWKELLVTMAAILFIAFLNLLYSALLGFFHFSFINFIIFIGITFSLGIFPVTISVFLIYFLKLRKHTQEAYQYSAGIKESSLHKRGNSSNLLSLKDEHGEILGEWKIEDILRMESAQNYIEIFYFTNENKVKRDLIRMTMKEVEQQSDSVNSLFRTHRSHIVNTEYIQKVKGNAQGLQISLRGSKEFVPVARSRISAFKKTMKEQ